MANLKPKLHQQVDSLDARNERVAYDFLRWLTRKTSSHIHFGTYRVTVADGQVAFVHPQESWRPDNIPL